MDVDPRDDGDFATYFAACMTGLLSTKPAQEWDWRRSIDRQVLVGEAFALAVEMVRRAGPRRLGDKP